MSGTVDTPVAHSLDDYGTKAHGVVQGTNTTFDNKKVDAVVVLDPSTGLPANFGAVGVSGGSMTVADGADIAQGAKADAAGYPTVIGLLKQLLEPATPMTRSDTYTGTTTGTAVNASTGDTPVAYALQVKGTGTTMSTTWNVVLEVSLDGTNFTTVLTHQTSTGDGVVLHATAFPALYFRSRVTALTLDAATNIIVHILAKA